MKKSILILSAFICFSRIAAQTTVFEDTFESYTVGQGVAAQGNGWDTWTGAPNLDALVSSAIPAFSGTKCARIQGTTTDLALPIGPYNSGKYDVKWMMYIPSGAGAYFNAMHLWSSSSTTYEWACQIYIANNGSTTWTTGGTPGGAVMLPSDEWFPVQITADMDMNVGKLYLDGVMVQQWIWSLDDGDGTSGLNQIAAVDFYGAGGAMGDEEGLYYIDDVKVIESTGVGIGEVTSGIAAPVIFPNPSTGLVHMQIDGEWMGGMLSITDLMGRVVLSESLTTEYLVRKLDLQGLNAGIYLVNLNKGDHHSSSRLVIGN